MLGNVNAKIAQFGTTGNLDVDSVYLQVSRIFHWRNEFPKLDNKGRL